MGLRDLIETLPALDLEEACRLQERLADLVREEDAPGEFDLVAGADAAYDRAGNVAHAAVAVWDRRLRAVVALATASVAGARRYLPGQLAWRELPALLAAFDRLEVRPDLVLADAHGRAHPRRCGLACTLGLALDLPTAGCAKEPLVGSHSPLAPTRGSLAPVRDRGEVVGVALRTRARVRPLFVSVGHRITLERAVGEVLRLARYRVPEPLRAAHHAAAIG